MACQMPSLVALLGLLAVAGYQNREKIREMLGQLGQSGGTAPEGQSGLGGILGNLGGMLGGVGAGGVLSGGLDDLLERFKQSGQGQTAESWVRQGPNQSVTPDQLERALGPEIIDSLTRQTGLSREELLARLTRTLPDAVDQMTPEGHVPTPEEAARMAGSQAR